MVLSCCWRTTQGTCCALVATKAQVNEVQAQTQTKIDVDFETDPCKCYIKAGIAASVRDK